MSEFLFKLIMGKQLDKVKELASAGAAGSDDKGVVAAEEDPEVAEARLEAEQKREAKYAKMEMKREGMRQQVRDKYNIAKPSNSLMIPPPCEGRITMQKSIIPPELPDDDDDFDPVKMVSNAFKAVKSMFRQD